MGYFSETDGQQLKKGMSALISPVTMAPQRDGNLLGVVESVSEYPVSFEAVVSLVGFPELASQADTRATPDSGNARITRG